MSNQESLALEVMHLVKHYPKVGVNAVDNVSFTVPQGEIFGLLGPNGAGKTTVIGILTTTILPSAGKVLIAGSDVVKYPIDVKQQIGVVPQMSNLDRSLNVREILTFHARYHGIPRSEAEARADTLLQELGLSKRSKEVLGLYSGGMAQRIMLARALMHSPRILFLDEPTNNLDPQTRLFLWERVRFLKEQGVAIVLTTHDMEEADQLCDRLAIMDHGQILALDTPQALRKCLPEGTRLELHIAIPGSKVVGNDLCTSSLTEKLPLILYERTGASKIEQVTISEDQKHQQADIVYRLYGDNVNELVGKTTQAIVEIGAELRDLHRVEPSLEDVFIFLTGRKLRS